MSEAGPDGSAVDPARWSMVDTIIRKRDGGTLGDADIRTLVTRYLAGDVPDYQMSALMMAIVWRGLDAAETLALTHAMVDSGESVDLSSLGRRIVDKHSTGGVGDKVSLALGPIVAACGVPFAKMSGRGLGHTGGTLDKLESIPGFTVELSQDAFLAQVREAGMAIVGQTADVVPADKRLYALRDVTGTVESIPLIAASVMSKKLAAGADAIVLDVKVGSGAFMRTEADARLLADTMIGIGRGAGRDVTVLLTDMSAPLGSAVGNALEMLEVVELLSDRGPALLRDLVLTAAGELLALSDLGVDALEGRGLAEASLADRSALAKYRQWIIAQGGDPDATLQLAPVRHNVGAPSAGTVTAIDARAVGRAAVQLGAGRESVGAPVDHGVGILVSAERGAVVAPGDRLCTVIARSDSDARAVVRQLEEAWTIDASVPPGAAPLSLVIDRLGGRLEAGD